MDAKKTLQLSMQEIKELKLCLEEKLIALERQENQMGKDNKKDTIERIMRKLEL